MTVLIIHDKDNLEAQFIIRGFNTILPNSHCDFIKVLDVKSIERIKITSAKTLIYVGKINNSTTYKAIQEAAFTFHGAIVGYNVWLNSPDISVNRKIDLFDHVYVEFKELLALIQHRLGTTYVHWSPHIAFLTPIDQYNNKPSIAFKPKVLIFF